MAKSMKMNDSATLGDRYNLISAARNGSARVCAAFGGQGPRNLNCFQDLVELYQNNDKDLRKVIEVASKTLSKLAGGSHWSGFHDSLGFELDEWLVQPDSAPGPEHMALAPMSFPINTLISLAQYCITCNALSLDPGAFRSCLTSTIGHSQGIFAAAAISRASSWESFYEVVDWALTISFYVGLEAHVAAPPARITATAAADCIEYGEGQPASMLVVTGLNEKQVKQLVEKVNISAGSDAQRVYLALRNARDKYVVAGPPQSLRSVCLEVRRISSSGEDQTRLAYNKRRPDVYARFLPVSAPFHTPYLNVVEQRVASAVFPPSPFQGIDLGIPVLHPSTGLNLQNFAGGELVAMLTRAVCFDVGDWHSVCSSLESTSHILSFAPGNVGSLVSEITEGSGLHIVEVARTPNLQSLPPELFSGGSGTEDEVHAIAQSCSWATRFGPRLVADECGNLRVETHMTRLFGTHAIMVGGMTPTTVSWDFCAAVANAGYHIEIAGGGYVNVECFESALRRLAAAIPAHRGITCNLLYANPRMIAWQVALLRRLNAEGINVAGITIGAGIPSPEVVREYIETLGLQHISFKPGSQLAIDQVIEIARQHPSVPVGLQWTGGRAGGHHSLEDFHEPILRSYSRIRACSNLVLIGGSGFGGAADTTPYLTGEWAWRFGYPQMPFDGIMLGSRMMVAKEAHTSLEAKKLIVDAPGVEDPEWLSTLDKPAGGVISIVSEMGQSIHMLATRGVMLWKEFDQHIFSIKDRKERLKYLQLHRDEIVFRLNRDYQRPWFAMLDDGQYADIEDMTYAQVIGRLCALLYVSRQSRWIDMTYLTLVLEFIHIAEERYGLRVDRSGERPKEIVTAFLKSFGPHAHDLLYPEDEALLLALFRRRGQKPVPFIPKLDENFETYFKKDSLWQSEDIDAVVECDAQRTCIIQGPVAVRYSRSCNESVKDILDGICSEQIRALRESGHGVVGCTSSNLTMPLPPDLDKLPGVHLTSNETSRLYALTGSHDLLDPDMLLRQIAGSDPWCHSALMEKWIYSNGKRMENPIRSAFHLHTGDCVEVELEESGATREITLYSQSQHPKAVVRTALSIQSRDGHTITATFSFPAYINLRTPRTELSFRLSALLAGGYVLHEEVPSRIDNFRNLYAHLWLDKDYPTFGISSLTSEIAGETAVLSQDAVQEFTNVIRQSDPVQLQNWNPQGHVPLDYCVVVAWKALTAPVTILAPHCDLSKLLHRSITFKYASSAAPLEIGDVLTTSSRITSNSHQPNGKLIEVSADINRAGAHVVAVKSVFFIPGQFPDQDEQFSSSDEPEMTVKVLSEVTQALLRSKRWLRLWEPTLDLVGRTLTFSLNSNTVYRASSTLNLLQVTGVVRMTNSGGGLSHVGRVHFKERCHGNPVMEFLRRHGETKALRSNLKSPGWNISTTAYIRAPLQSISYAKVSHDTNPIHVSPVFARFVGLPGTVVHGMHTSALVRRTIEWSVGDADRSRFRRWHVSFEGMVTPNDKLRIEFQHIAMEEGLMVFKVQAFNEERGEKVVEAEASLQQPHTALVFAGQGSQERGMGMALYESRPEAKDLWTRGEELLREKYGKYNNPRLDSGVCPEC